jgi:hypothetical protein
MFQLQQPQYMQQPSVIPQYNPNPNAQSAAGLQPQPGQQAYTQEFPKAPDASGNNLGLVGKLLKGGTALAANLIPQKLGMAEAATVATGLLGKQETNRQRNQLWRKWQMQQDKPRMVNSNKGMQYNPIYAQYGHD